MNGFAFQAAARANVSSSGPSTRVGCASWEDRASRQDDNARSCFDTGLTGGYVPEWEDEMTPLSRRDLLRTTVLASTTGLFVPSAYAQWLAVGKAIVTAVGFIASAVGIAGVVEKW